MKKAALKFKKYQRAVANTRVARNDIDRTILQIILWSFGAVAFFYVFFLGNMVFNIVERRSIESDLRILGNEVGDLELTFLAMSNEIDLELSHSLGFKEVETTFAIRQSSDTLGLRSLDNRVRSAQNGI